MVVILIVRGVMEQVRAVLLVMEVVYIAKTVIVQGYVKGAMVQPFVPIVMVMGILIAPIVQAIMDYVIPVKAGDGKLNQNGAVLSVEVLEHVYIVMGIIKTQKNVLRVVNLENVVIAKTIKANAVHVVVILSAKPVEATAIVQSAKTVTASVRTAQVLDITG